MLSSQNKVMFALAIFLNNILVATLFIPGNFTERIQNALK